MKKIIWDNDFQLGVKEVDEQHKKLVSLIGELFDALDGDENDYYLKRGAILKALVDYTLYHFSTEEKLFEVHNYAATELHKSQHRTFISEVSRQVENVLVADISHGKMFYGFLCTWLLSHIAKADKTFCTELLQLKKDS